MSIFDELRGMVIDLPVGKILPGWVEKSAVIRAIDRLEQEHENGEWDHSCPTCQSGGHVVPPPHRLQHEAAAAMERAVGE